MASVIQLKRSSSASAVPASGQLRAGELAINLADKKLFSSTNGTDIITISGDQYNLPLSGNSSQAVITLTVDNASLSNDAITLVGTNGTVVAASNATHITIDSTTYAVTTSGNSTIGQIVLTPTGGGDAGGDTLSVVGANGITVSGNSTQITVTADGDYYDLSAGGNATTGTVVLGGDADTDTVTFQGANNIVVKNVDGTTNEVYLQNNVTTATVTTTGYANVQSTTNSTSNTTGALVVAGGVGIGKSVVIGENLTVFGDLTIEGTTTTVNSTTVTIDDAALKLADNQADTTTFTDTADFGIYGEWGNTSEVHYSGIFRDASANVFVVVNDISTEPGATVTYTAANSSSTGDLGQLDAIIDGGTY